MLCGLCGATKGSWEILNEGESFRNDLKQVEWTGSGFVAVGENAILTSGDGLNWELAALDEIESDTYVEISSGPGSLVIGRNTAVFSADLVVWQQSTLPAGVSFLSAAGNDSQFLALGDDGSFYRSTDGLSWSVSGDAPGSAKMVSFGNGRWVSFDETHFYHSLDGVTWTAVEQAGAVNAAGESRYVPEVDEVDFSGGLFVANRILDEEFLWNSYAVSSDGVTWAVAEAPLYEIYDSSSGVTEVSLSGLIGEQYGDSLEVDDVHFDSLGNEVVIHSGNIAVNSFGNYSENYYFQYADSASSPSGRVIVVGNDGLIMTSDQPFEEYSSWREVGLRDLVLGDAASDGITVIGVWKPYDRVNDWEVGDSVVLKTEDGTVWKALEFSQGDELKGDEISFVNDRWFLADYSQDHLFTSTDAMTWTQETVLFSDEVMPVASERLYGGGVYLSVSALTGFQSQRRVGRGVSSDGIEWDDLPEDVHGAGAFGNGEFKVLQEDRVFSSANGIDWTSELIETLPGAPNSLLFFNGRWIASYYSADSFFLDRFSVISNDCLNWWPLNVRAPLLGLNIEVPIDSSNISQSNGRLIEGNWYAMSSSEDGLNWEHSSFPEEVRSFDYPLGPIFTETLSLSGRILGLGQNQMAVISSPIAPVKETTGLKLLKPSFLEMAGTAGKEYRLLEFSTLKEIDWIPVGDWLPATADGQVLFWGTDADEGRMFYRVEER